jgi:hypothetical protein
MAPTAPALIPAQKHPAFDMQSLWRTAAWGLSASLALLLAVMAGYSETGSRRLMATLSGPGAPMQLTASAAPEAQTDRAASTEALRALAADRDRLAARLDMIERQIDDLTGSIKAQPARQALTSSLASPAVSGPSASSPAREATRPISPETPSAGDGPVETRSEAAPRAASVAPAEHAPSPEEPKPSFGVDIGGATNFDGLRQLWTSTKSSNAAAFEGLNPIVAVNESGRGRSPELRLIVGPFSDAETAVRWCATLAAANRFCQLSSFEGQRLTDADRVIDRKPSARPAPRNQPPKLFGLF